MTDEVVVGVGNPIMGDDGVGKHIVDALYEHPAVADSDVTVTHAGTTAFLALEALSGADRGVVVDAVSDGDSRPGAVHRYRLTDGSFEGEPPDVFMHDFSFSEAIRAGSEAYDLPPDVAVLGVEPADTTAGVELSDPVSARLPAVVEVVLAELTTVDSTEATPAVAPDATAGDEETETASQDGEQPANRQPPEPSTHPGDTGTNP